MAPFPLTLADYFGHWGAYGVFLVIGFAFGYVLEIAGFGNSKKLAAQFYFQDMTVLKVMFAAIVVAMALIFLASGLGLLDYNLVWVNPTYLWPGIVGGLLMGVGFIVGGFCPGTSLVAAATFKIDGVFFVLGVFFGIFLFGETVEGFEDFWNSSYYGRYTIPEFLGLDTGIVVLLIVLMALFMFFGSEKLERIFGQKDPRQAPKWRYSAAGALIALAVAGLFVGQPETADRWNTIAADKEALLAEEKVQIHPGELLKTIHDTKINLVMLDVRSEADYNLFHILDARHVPLESIKDKVPDLRLEPPNTVVVVMSNEETAATEAWKTLVAESIPNVYILDGGINNWIDTFAAEDFKQAHARADVGDDELGYAFDVALGARYPAAQPHEDAYTALEFEEKITLQAASGPTSGGCG